VQTNEKILEKFQQMIANDQQILHQCGWDGREHDRHPGNVDYLRLRTETSANSLMCCTCGINSVDFSKIEPVRLRVATGRLFTATMSGLIRCASANIRFGELHSNTFPQLPCDIFGTKYHSFLDINALTALA
jgi:hypothetical protein